jgi:flavodoxin I
MRTIIVFGSFVGNTETMAGYIALGLAQAGITAEQRDVVNLSSAELLNYNLILMGSPTYEPKMIQDDMLPLYSQLEHMDLTGRMAVAFGPGDSAWPDFCTAVEMIESRLQQTGAHILASPYTIDGIVEEHRSEAIAWGREIGMMALSCAAASSSQPVRNKIET